MNDCETPPPPPRAPPATRRFRMPHWLRSLANVAVPPLCVACQVRLGDDDALCGGCWREVNFIRAPLCDRLGIPLPFGGRPGSEGPLISAAAAADPPPWSRARAVALYEGGGVMARLIGRMKYADRHDAHHLFARWLRVAGAEVLADADLLVPVPMTRWRFVRRQFNQAAVLARQTGRLAGVASDPFALVKTRTTRPQVELSGAARRENVRGVFQVPESRRDRIAGRRIVLLDDVVTTGATAEAATRALLAAGAIRVDVLSLARAPIPTSGAP